MRQLFAAIDDAPRGWREWTPQRRGPQTPSEAVLMREIRVCLFARYVLDTAMWQASQRRILDHQARMEA